MCCQQCKWICFHLFFDMFGKCYYMSYMITVEGCQHAQQHCNPVQFYLSDLFGWNINIPAPPHELSCMITTLFQPLFYYVSDRAMPNRSWRIHCFLYSSAGSWEHKFRTEPLELVRFNVSHKDASAKRKFCQIVKILNKFRILVLSHWRSLKCFDVFQYGSLY